ncbi:MAG: hypothetical protein ACTTKH_07360 [Treponema sp.]
MKKSYFILFLLIAGLSSFLHSQEMKEAEMYYVNVPIIKAYQHNDGYYIIYRRANFQTGEAFVPHKWFSPKDGRGEVRKINTKISPYMSVFTKNGKFEFVKVCLPIDNPRHSVWGFLSNPSEYDGKFSNETVELQF